MNSVISAFKGKKNSAANCNSPTSSANGTVPGESKQNHGGGLVGVGISIASVGGGVAKKKPVAQSSGYQYLRHIREIETAIKIRVQSRRAAQKGAEGGFRSAHFS